MTILLSNTLKSNCSPFWLLVRNLGTIVGCAYYTWNYAFRPHQKKKNFRPIFLRKFFAQHPSFFFQNIPAHQSQCWYICKTFRSDIPPASSVTNWWKNSNYHYRERGLYGFCRHKPWKQLVPILHKLQVDRDKVESLQVVGAKFRYWLCKVVQGCWP